MGDTRSLVKQPRGLAPQSELRALLNRFLREGEDDPFAWDSLTVENGLPNNWIYDLFQDSPPDQNRQVGCARVVPRFDRPVVSQAARAYGHSVRYRLQ